MDDVHAKYDALKSRLREAGSVLLAYSGGVDSTLLLRAALDALGPDGVHPVLVVSTFLPGADRDRAGALCRTLGAALREITMDWKEDETIAANPPDRCFHCKKRVLASLEEEGRRLGAGILAEGTVTDDALDHRPGARALADSAFSSPLAEAGMDKNDVRTLSRRLGLPTWDLPSNACLATRFPFGHALSDDELHRVDRAEEALRNRGFALVRVRSHGDLASIEVDADQVERLTERATRDTVTRDLRALGFRHVTVDLSGYRTGSLNPGGEGEEAAS